MAGLLTNSEKAEKTRQVAERNQQALARFADLYHCRHGDDSSHASLHWQQVTKTRFPQFRHEDWRYTPLEQLLSQQYSGKTWELTIAQCEQLAIPMDCWRIVMVDGCFSPLLSSGEFGPYQLSLLDNKSGLPVPIQSEIFLHLTESLAQQPLVITLKAGQVAEKPLYLLNITSGYCSEALNTSHYRYHITVGANAGARVIEHFVSTDEQQPHMTGSRLTADVGDNASLIHIKLGVENSESYHFAHNDIVVGRDARVKSTSFLLGAGLGRHNTSVQLNGEGANLSLNSLLLPQGKEVADTRTYLEHNKGHCESRQLHKTIVMDQSKAVFNGMIKVAHHALKTDGQMTNNNLLLGKQAEVDTKPQLEIYADDVKCSHGATVGRIDEEQLFYLQSRGISRCDAQHMIIFAFAAELTESIEDEALKTVVMKHIKQRLAGVEK
ncbi:Fe-S cluster assembly protein SufD [Photorhabdus khanii]|uniref:FeS cluster assembly protein SufD n=1 Tax=Photorhabdus khanii subsp. guanajuatensis TaxID=2100166 RepID=A0A4R4K6G1_9GAMM|nr:Fe-S cluster assembly protein SufD [Photorhabdus khanii]TDB63107.1 FeS cluster assembly protein SufD [Photorhabdus khanii subsp. guanajuatensis]